MEPSTTTPMITWALTLHQRTMAQIWRGPSLSTLLDHPCGDCNLILQVAQGATWEETISLLQPDTASAPFPLQPTARTFTS